MTEKSLPFHDYFFTEQVRKELRDSPDLVVQDTSTGQVLSFVFSNPRAQGSLHAAFCLRTRKDGSIAESSAVGISRDDVLRGIGRDVFYLVKRIDQEETEDYHRQLELLEQRYTIDLSVSKHIPIEQVRKLKKIGHRFVNWIQIQGYKSDEEISRLHQCVEEFVVLTKEDKSNLFLADEQKNLQSLKDMKTQLIENGTWEQATEEEREIFEEYIGFRLDAIASLQEGKVTCGTQFMFSDSNGDQKPLCVFLDPREESQYYSTIVGAVAEEIMHAASNILKVRESLVDALRNPELIIDLAELAVEYYVVHALKDCGVNETTIAAYASLNPDCIPIWTSVVQRIGEENAVRFFFHGDIELETWHELIECLKNDERWGGVGT